MLIEEAVYQLLSANAGVTALASGRIFAGVLPQDLQNYPAIAYRAPATGNRMNRRTIQVMEGGCSLVAQRIHVFSAAKGKRDYGPAAELDAAVCGALEDYQGTVSIPASSPLESIYVQGIFATTLAHAYGFDDKTQTHNFVTEFEIHYTDPNRL